MSKSQINSFEAATGEIAVTLRNDLMFHHVMQTSKEALKSFICASKNLSPDKVKDVTIQNPIEIDEAVSNEIILDVLVTLNSNENIDIELQLYYDKFWISRSLVYLCRTFDNLVNENDESLLKYERVRPTTLIAIIDKNVAFDSDEFYSSYQMQNVRSHVPYSSLLSIKVLNLSQIDAALEEDINSGLTGWAKLFLANTWEEVNNVVALHPCLKEVAKIMYEANADLKKRSLMRAHEEYLMRVQSAERRLKEAEEKLNAAENKAKAAEDEAKATKEKLAALEAKLKAANIQL